MCFINLLPLRVFDYLYVTDTPDLFPVREDDGGADVCFMSVYVAENKLETEKALFQIYIQLLDLHEPCFFCQKQKRPAHISASKVCIRWILYLQKNVLTWLP